MTWNARTSCLNADETPDWLFDVEGIMALTTGAGVAADFHRFPIDWENPECEPWNRPAFSPVA